MVGIYQWLPTEIASLLNYLFQIKGIENICQALLEDRRLTVQKIVVNT